MEFSSMGWKLNLALVGAIIAAILIFRKQIGEAFFETGAAVGESVSGGFGGFFSGLTGQTPEGYRGISAGSVTTRGNGGGGYGIYQPGPYGGRLFGIPNLGEIFAGGAPQQAYGETPLADTETVSPYTREISDIPIIVRSRTLGQIFEFKHLAPEAFVSLGQPVTMAFKAALAEPRTIGHAQRVREIASQTGLPTPKVVFEAARQSALRSGMTPSEALRLAKQAILK